MNRQMAGEGKDIIPLKHKCIESQTQYIHRASDSV